ncbi:MAG: T9SS type A sorting domain-containing protein [Saprospiraceae bacterium]|nr:T9SS type A sorting domain-containing protein [Saprospiraceae bacterium]
MNKILLVICMCMFTFSSFAQTYLEEDFEDATITYTPTPVDDLSDIGALDYYGRIAPDTSTPSSAVEFTNTQGSGYYGAQDTDGAIVPAGSIVLDFTGIDISSAASLEFSIFVAEDDATDGNQDWDGDSRLFVEYQIDAGGYASLFAVETESVAGDQTNERPLVDTDFDGIGDGAEITAAFTQYIQAITGTGTTLDLRITMAGLNAGDEDIAIDNVVVREAGGGSPSIHLTQVNSTTETITITNLGDAAEDISAFQICLGPGEYNALSDYTGITGDLMLDPSEAVTIDVSAGGGTGITALPDAAGGLGLFSTGGSFGSTDPAIFRDYVQWGAASQDRSGQAVTAGRWDDAMLFVGGFAPYDFTGGVADHGSTFWTGSPPPLCFTLDGTTNGFEIVTPVPATAGSQSEWALNAGAYDMNAFCGGGCQQMVDTWLIFGPLDFSAAADVELVLDAVESFGVTDLNVQLTESYQGCPDDPANSWSSLGTIVDGGVGLSFPIASTGTAVYLGIQYTDDGLDGFSDWVLSNITLNGSACPVLGMQTPSNCGPTCDFVAGATSTSCDAETMGVDTYTASLAYTGGMTGQTYTVMSNVGTVAGDDPNTVAAGTITVTGIDEGTDVQITITTADMACNEVVDITSPICEPFNPPAVRINELDADTPDTDAAEFIELRGPAGQSLDGFIIVLYNGSDDQSYNTPIDLNGQTIPDDGDGFGYFVIGSATVPNVDLVAFTTNGLQNGADGVGLYFNRTVAEFPNDTPIDFTNLVDGLAYDTNDADDAALIPLNLDLDTPGQINEGENGAQDTESIQRGSWFVAAPSPGAANVVPLPVELASFTASLTSQDKVELAWKTLSEEDNSHFEVEYSVDGSNWVNVGQLPGAGTTPFQQNYTFTHDNPAQGTNLYKLKQVDLDGDFKYSHIVAVEIGTKIKVTAYDGERLEVFTPKAGDLRISVYNVAGQLVAFEDQPTDRGNATFSVADLSRGVYFVRIELNGEQQVQKIIK